MTEVTITNMLTVELVDHMGDDHAIAQAARVSTIGAQYQDIDEVADGRLISYLMRDRHASPFEHCVMKFRITCPLFTGRQILRHRTNSYNEESGRYREMEPLFYVPPPERPLVQIGKPGHYTFELGTQEQHELTLHSLVRAYSAAWREYQFMLSKGIAREVARAALPSGLFSTMYMTAKLRNAFQFVALRIHDAEADVVSHPQWEIEQVARQMDDFIKELFPDAWTAWVANGRPSL